jgi:methylenetetrahydrofolate reductase (NADPH)
VEHIQELREVPGIAGFHIMAIEWEEKVPEIVERSGLYPRPEV